MIHLNLNITFQAVITINQNDRDKCNVVYKLTFPNNKVYIGQTSQKLMRRIRQHCEKDSKCRKLKYAIDKYKDFMVEVLYEGPELDKMENFYIDKYDSINCGYNLLPSRVHCTAYGFKGKTHTEEYKKFMKTQQAKPIAQYDLKGTLIKTFISIRSTIEDGFNAGKVCEVLKGKRKHHKNFIFKYI